MWFLDYTWHFHLFLSQWSHGLSLNLSWCIDFLAWDSLKSASETLQLPTWQQEEVNLIDIQRLDLSSYRVFWKPHLCLEGSSHILDFNDFIWSETDILMILFLLNQSMLALISWRLDELSWAFSRQLDYAM